MSSNFVPSARVERALPASAVPYPLDYEGVCIFVKTKLICYTNYKMKPTNQQLAFAIARAIQEGGWTVRETQWAFLSGFMNALLWTGRVTVDDGDKIVELVAEILKWKCKSGLERKEPS